MQEVNPGDDVAPADRDWWRKTWAEREAALVEAYGKVGSTIPFSTEQRRLSKLPGTCILVFPPDAAARRSHWLYATHGLSQPLAPKDVGAFLPDAPPRSRGGYELAVAVREPSDWVPQALFLLARYCAGQDIRPGVRLSFQFARAKNPAQDPDALHPIVGMVPQEMSQTGETAAAILWPALDREGPFVTSTGRFDLLVATTITGPEWELANGTSSAHVLYLLVLAGTGQRIEPLRRTVTQDPRWQREWERIRELSKDSILDALYGPK